MTKNLHKTAIVLALLISSGMAQAANLTASGYAENFDSMGVSGTTAPNGWKVYTGASSTSNSTWTTSISASDVAAMTVVTSALTATSSPTATNNNGYNAAKNSSSTSDRLLTTSPTTTSGAALQLTLTNATGASFNELYVSYDTQRFTSTTTANELPGYELFYSLNGTSWTNVSALNPTITSVPNTVGTTSVSNALVTFSSNVTAGQSFYLRWVDDNAKQTSPDQIIGLNNVVISAVVSSVPEPETYAMLMAGLGLMAAIRRNKKSN